MMLEVGVASAELPPGFPPGRARPGETVVERLGLQVQRVEAVGDHRVIVEVVERLAGDPHSLAQAGAKEGRRHRAVGALQRRKGAFEPLARTRNLRLPDVEFEGVAEPIAQPECAEADRLVGDRVVVNVQEIGEIGRERVAREDQPSSRNTEVVRVVDWQHVARAVGPGGFGPREAVVAEHVLVADLQRERGLLGIMREDGKPFVVVHVKPAAGPDGACTSAAGAGRGL